MKNKNNIAKIIWYVIKITTLVTAVGVVVACLPVEANNSDAESAIIGVEHVMFGSGYNDAVDDEKVIVDGEADTTTTNQEVNNKPIININKSHAAMLAKVMYGEARGIASITEQACIAWTILNRVDAGYGSFEEVITAPNQFYYKAHFPTVDDYDRDLVALAEDILYRWESEKLGNENVGRVLPSGYFWYYGDGEHNWFRNKFNGQYQIWDYSMKSPYES